MSTLSGCADGDRSRPALMVALMLLQIPAAAVALAGSILVVRGLGLVSLMPEPLLVAGFAVVWLALHFSVVAVGYASVKARLLRDAAGDSEFVKKSPNRTFRDDKVQ